MRDKLYAMGYKIALTFENEITMILQVFYSFIIYRQNWNLLII